MQSDFLRFVVVNLLVFATLFNAPQKTCLNLFCACVSRLHAPDYNQLCFFFFFVTLC